MLEQDDNCNGAGQVKTHFRDKAHLHEGQSCFAVECLTVFEKSLILAAVLRTLFNASQQPLQSGLCCGTEAHIQQRGRSTTGSVRCSAIGCRLLAACGACYCGRIRRSFFPRSLGLKS